MSYVLTIIGAVLSIIMTGLIGSSFAAAWQRRNWLYQQKMENSKKKFDERKKLVSDLFGLVHERVYATRMYADALLTGEERIYELERAKYREIVYRWNANFPAQVIQMKALFSAQAAYNFDLFFPKEFSSSDAILGSARRSIENKIDATSRIDAVKLIMSSLSVHASNMSTDLLYESEEDRRFLDQNPLINEKNVDDLSYAYLLKSLFKPRAYS